MYDGKIVTKQTRLNLIERWMKIHEDDLDFTTAEELLVNPSSSRKSSIRKKFYDINKITIDLTIEDNNSNHNIANNEKKMIVRNKKKEEYKKRMIDRTKILNEEEKTPNHISKKTKKKPLGKEYWIKLSTKTLHRRKDLIKKKRFSIHYQIRKEERNCFLYGIRTISDSFNLSTFKDYFKDLDIKIQIKLANKVLMDKEGSELKNMGTFFSSLEKMRTMMDGRYLLVFTLGDQLHVEGLCNKQFSSDMQKEVLEEVDVMRSFEVYKLEMLNKMA